MSGLNGYPGKVVGSQGSRGFESLSLLQMCYLCLQENPFAIKDPNTLTIQNKKARAALIKELLKDLESYNSCVDGSKEIEKLKAEQYQISQSI